MRLGWHIHLFGPFSVGGTLWRSKRRRRGYHGTLPGWKCPHGHSRPDLAEACAQREARRRQAARQQSPQAQRAIAAARAASDGLSEALTTAQPAADGTVPGSHFAGAMTALHAAVAELETLTVTDPRNPAIPELSEALNALTEAFGSVITLPPGEAEAG
jgi:hypothetical protein